MSKREKDGNGDLARMLKDVNGRAGCTRWRTLLVVGFSAVCLLRPAGSLHAQTRTNAGNTGPAQFGDLVTSQAREGPIDISSQGGTTYSQTPAGRVATGTNGVVIQSDDGVIYCDHAEYNLDTKEALLVGNVRIYRLDSSLLADRAVYNFETKRIHALDFNGSRPPFAFGGVDLFSPLVGAQYNVREGTFTTDDSSKPDYHLKARRIRIYPDNRVIYVDTTLYVGTTKVFYFPYFFQSLDQQSGYQVTPGYSSTFGAYLLTGITFPITDHVTGIARLDYRTARGPGVGLNLEYKPNRRVPNATPLTGASPFASDDDPSVAAATGTGPGGATPHNAGGANSGNNPFNNGDDYALTGPALSKVIRRQDGIQFLSYYTHDDHPDLNRTSLDRLPVDVERYRFALKGTQTITDDLYIKVDADKLSDRYLLQDFYEGEFTRDPNPDNVAEAVYHRPTFVATLVGRAQFNDFFDTTARLPEATLEFPHLPLGEGTGIYYTTTSSAGFLRRTFDSASPLPEYSTFRLDTYHQFNYAHTFLGWLSVVPRVGFRATYYGHSAPSNDSAAAIQGLEDDAPLRSLFGLDTTNASAADLARRAALQQSINDFEVRGSVFRPVVDAGFEASFKLSRVYKDVGSRALGLDQLQHIVQPYINLAVVEDFGVGSRELLQFDRRLPTTQLLPLTFPQYNSVDSINEATDVRIGVRNRFQTKRDALTFNWLEVDTFFQVSPYDPAYQTRVSNVFNQVTFRPLPWMNATIDSQLPIFNGSRGFAEIDTALSVMPTSNLNVVLSHRYLNNNPFFVNSSLLRLNVYYRLDDNWSAGFSERYEFSSRLLQAQSYTIYRDLTSFVASVGLTVRDNNGVNDYGFLFNLTLKGVPKVSLPVGFDVNNVANDLQ